MLLFVSYYECHQHGKCYFTNDYIVLRWYGLNQYNVLQDYIDVGLKKDLDSLGIVCCNWRCRHIATLKPEKLDVMSPVQVIIHLISPAKKIIICVQYNRFNTLHHVINATYNRRNVANAKDGSCNATTTNDGLQVISQTKNNIISLPHTNDGLNVMSSKLMIVCVMPHIQMIVHT